MKFNRLTYLILVALAGLSSFLAMVGFVLGNHGEGGGP